jgi:hypothetical protein
MKDNKLKRSPCECKQAGKGLPSKYEDLIIRGETSAGGKHCDPLWQSHPLQSSAEM